MDHFSVSNPNLLVNFSFWFATAMMLASTAFFYVERKDVSIKWKTSLTVAMLVTGIDFGTICICQNTFLIQDSHH